MRGVCLQFEAVGGLYQRHFLTGNDILAADIPPQDAQHFIVSQPPAFPRFVLLHRTFLGRTLIPELGDQRNRFVVMFLQCLVGLDLIEVFFQPVLELAVFRHRFFRDFLM